MNALLECVLNTFWQAAAVALPRKVIGTNSSERHL